MAEPLTASSQSPEGTPVITLTLMPGNGRLLRSSAVPDEGELQMRGDRAMKAERAVPSVEPLSKGLPASSDEAHRELEAGGADDGQHDPLETALFSVEQMVFEIGGTVLARELEGGEAPTRSITVRIPERSFDEFYASLSVLGERVIDTPPGTEEAAAGSTITLRIHLLPPHSP
jgi:hypothetical protein